MTGKYRRMKERVKRSLSYWIGLARSEFSSDLNRFMVQEPRTSRAELARRLGTSPAYITKVLNDTAGNFTLETMAKMARAMDAVLHIRLAREGELVKIEQPQSQTETVIANFDERGLLQGSYTSRIEVPRDYPVSAPGLWSGGVLETRDDSFTALFKAEESSTELLN